MKNEIIEIGFLEKGTGKHQSNIVYSIEGISPTVCAMWMVKQPPGMVLIRSNNGKKNN